MFDVNYIVMYVFFAGNGYVAGTYTTTTIKRLQHGSNFIGNVIVFFFHTHGKKTFQNYFTTRPYDETGGGGYF